MDNLTLALVVTTCLAVYMYGVYTFYTWMLPFELSRKDRLFFSAMWLPTLVGVVFCLVMLGLVFAVAIPVVGILIIVDTIYKRLTGKSFLITDDKIKFDIDKN